MKSYLLLIACIALIFTAAYSDSLPYPYSPDDIAMYRNTLLENVFFSGTDAIVAARSKETPNYWYDWARDSGLTMGVLLSMFNSNGTDLGPFFQRYDRNIRTQISWPQGFDNIDIRGQAKWNTDGTIYNQPWCNNQNDGAAFRTIIRIQYANYLLQQGFEQIVIDHHYLRNGNQPGVKWELEYISHNWQNTNCCDLWEECSANHFFSLLAMRKSLLLGAKLSIHVQDPDAATFYVSQAQAISDSLEAFVDYDRFLILPSRNYPAGSTCSYKDDMDSATFLGALYGEFDDSLLSQLADSMLHMFQHDMGCNSYHLIPNILGQRQQKNFKQFSFENRCHLLGKSIQVLNQNDTNLNSFKPHDPRVLQSLDGVAQWSLENLELNKDNLAAGFVEANIARYPNDIYDGTGMSRGNAWVLSNMAAAEVMFRTAYQIKLNFTKTKQQGCYFDPFAVATYHALLSYLPTSAKSTVENYIATFEQNRSSPGVFNSDKTFCSAIQEAYTQRGIQFMTVVKHHLGSASDLPEQIHRETGFAQGAHYLTWSYSTLVSADLVYQKLVKQGGL